MDMKGGGEGGGCCLFPRAAFLCHNEVFPFPPRESTAISKRKPPSQRPERKMDATARAIADAREQSEADKPVGPKRSREAGPMAQASRGRGMGGRPVSGGPAPSPSTKRPKQPGS